MQRTMNELATEMTNLGYPIEKRRLIDWVQKGLLPHPKHQGLGRTKGSVYYWTQPDILEQAITVYKQLAGYGRVSGIYLPLWLLGYDVPLERVRRGLLDLLSKVQAELTAAMASNDELAEHLSTLACKMASKWLHWQGHRWDVPAEVVELVLNVFANPSYEPSDEVLQVSVETFLKPIPMESAMLPAIEADPALIEIARQSMRFIQEYLSLPQLHHVLTTATEVEFKQVHRNLRHIVNTFRSLLEQVVPDGSEVSNWEWLVDSLTITFGPWVSLGDLSLRRGSHGETIDRILLLTFPWLLRPLLKQYLTAKKEE